MKNCLMLICSFFFTFHSFAQYYSSERRDVRIGEVGNGGNINVAEGSITKQLNLDFTGYRDVATDQIGARISALRFNIYQPNNALRQNSGLAFYTNPIGLNSGITDLVERMRITPYGNVGIGTSTPNFKLDIAGDLRATSARFETGNNDGIRIGKLADAGNLSAANGVSAQLNIDFTGYRDVAADQIGARISALRFGQLRQNTGLAFYTNPSGMNVGTTDLVERIRINPSGNIGIGTSEPEYLLDVAGNLRATSAYFESENNSGIRIGKIKDGGNLDVTKGSLASQINLDFTGYRDSEPDQIGARISALRFNNWDDKALVQNTGLAFYTNPIGWNAGIIDVKERMRISPLGNIGIGTANPEYLLDVAGIIRAEEIKVEIKKGSDFVFDKNYKLLPLHEVESFVQENRHLPEVPSEKKMQEEGLNINEFQIKLLQKIEELTLYIIDQDKRIVDQNNRLKEQSELVKLLQTEIAGRN